MGLSSNPTTDSNSVTHYGYTYKLTPDHIPPSQLAPYQYSYDTLGSSALEILDTLSPPPPPRAGVGWIKKNSDNEKPEPPQDRDLYTLLRDNSHKDEILKKLWDEVTVVPEWVDWEQIKRGQDVLYRYAGPALLAFGLHGLVGSTGASSRAAETLVRTGGHSVKVARRRFFETFQLLLEVTKSLESIQPGGTGHASVIRVRLLHATVRQRILKLASQRPGYFSIEKQGGVPINDLDTIQSVCAFSADLLFLGLPAQGIKVRKQEEEDYIALWRWVGHVIGAPVWYMENPRTARAMMESVMPLVIVPSANSKVLLENILKALDGVSPLYAPREWWEAGGRYVNGDTLSDAIGLGKPTFYYRGLIACQTWVFRSMASISRSVPSMDKWMVESSRKAIWEYVIESDDGLGEPTKYEFKYIPDLDEKTGTKKENTQKQSGEKKIGIEALVIYATITESAVLAVLGLVGVFAIHIVWKICF